MHCSALLPLILPSKYDEKTSGFFPLTQQLFSSMHAHTAQHTYRRYRRAGRMETRKEWKWNWIADDDDDAWGLNLRHCIAACDDDENNESEIESHDENIFRMQNLAHVKFILFKMPEHFRLIFISMIHAYSIWKMRRKCYEVHSSSISYF